MADSADEMDTHADDSDLDYDPNKSKHLGAPNAKAVKQQQLWHQTQRQLQQQIQQQQQIIEQLQQEILILRQAQSQQPPLTTSPSQSMSASDSSSKNLRKRKQTDPLAPKDKFKKVLTKATLQSYLEQNDSEGIQVRPMTPANKNNTSNLLKAATEVKLSKQYVNSNQVKAKTISLSAASQCGKNGSSNQRLPPITVQDITSSRVDSIMAELKISNYNKTLLRKGVNIHCSSADEFKTVRGKLDELKHTHYSHDLPEDKLYKVALKGLHHMESSELLAELEIAGLAPKKIREIASNAKNRQDVIYIISFAKGVTSLAELNRNHYAIAHTRVTWAHYEHKGGTVTCVRCQLPSHGIKYCSMAARCRYCAENHESSQCEVRSRDPSFKPKCCNCGGEHFANFKECPAKAKYLTTRRSRNIKSTKDKGMRVNSTSSPLFSVGGVSYAQVLGQREGTRSSGPSGKFSSPFGVLSPSDTSCHFGTNSYSSSQFPSGTERNDPFSVEELLALTRVITTSLADIQTMPRREAMSKVWDITVRFLYHHD